MRISYWSSDVCSSDLLYDFAGRTGDILPRYYFGSDQSAQELIGNTILQYDASFGSVDSSTLASAEYRDASSSSSSFYGPASSIDLPEPVYTGPPSSVGRRGGQECYSTCRSRCA